MKLFLALFLLFSPFSSQAAPIDEVKNLFVIYLEVSRHVFNFEDSDFINLELEL